MNAKMTNRSKLGDSERTTYSGVATALRYVPDFDHRNHRIFCGWRSDETNWFELRVPAGYRRTLVDLRVACHDDCALTICLVVSGESTRSDWALKQASGKTEACSSFWTLRVQRSPTCFLRPPTARRLTAREHRSAAGTRRAVRGDGLYGSK